MFVFVEVSDLCRTYQPKIFLFLPCIVHKICLHYAFYCTELCHVLTSNGYSVYKQSSVCTMIFNALWK